MKHAALVCDFSMKKTDEPEFLEQMLQLAALLELIASVYPAGAHGDPHFVSMVSTGFTSDSFKNWPHNWQKKMLWPVPSASHQTSLTNPMPYTVTTAKLPEVLILEFKVFGDSRGFFLKLQPARLCPGHRAGPAVCARQPQPLSQRRFARPALPNSPPPQGKFLCITQGEVFDVVVDVRRSSPNFSKWDCVLLSADYKRQLWVPPCFAHGFMVPSDTAEFLYKRTDYWSPVFERSLLWNAPTVGVQRPLTTASQLAAKDDAAKTLAKVEVFA